MVFFAGTNRAASLSSQTTPNNVISKPNTSTAVINKAVIDTLNRLQSAMWSTRVCAAPMQGEAGVCVCVCVYVVVGICGGAVRYCALLTMLSQTYLQVVITE